MDRFYSLGEKLWSSHGHSHTKFDRTNLKQVRFMAFLHVGRFFE